MRIDKAGMLLPPGLPGFAPGRGESSLKLLQVSGLKAHEKYVVISHIILFEFTLYYEITYAVKLCYYGIYSAGRLLLQGLCFPGIFPGTADLRLGKGKLPPPPAKG